ncbi:MAG TPA: DUF2007 domain-containing protein [Planctomycetes bacterium]|nr:DUF2007 domain-containing protein [Planctomycetota bacterium]
MVDRFIEVSSALDIPHAYLLKSVLEEEGIEVRIGNEFLQAGLGELPAGFATSPRILVYESDAPRARKILAEAEKVDGED